MFQKIVNILGGNPHKKEVQQLSTIVDVINDLEPEFGSLSDDALRAKTAEFKQRIAEWQSKGDTLNDALEDILPEAYATVREASKRTIGLRPYDVQLIGGMTLHHSKISEMRTGEGKTLVATLPLYLNALAGRGVHLVTVNDYLARRDARWMGPIYQMLGLTVGVLQMAARTDNGRNAFLVDLEKTSPHEDQNQLKLVLRAAAYQADITYGTNSEFGFDYLRDNLTMSLAERVQRGHYYAIVDEVDNILIDEARTPLIISGPASEDTEWYNRTALVVRQLRTEDVEVNEKDHNVTLTEIGEVHVEELLQMQLRDPDRPEDVTPEQARVMGYMEQALRAQYLFRRNKEYLVQAGKVVIVDEFTGRLMPGRRWSEGLHQAVEAKEGVKVEPENVTYATITLQNYFRMYEKLAGMTGTALTEAEEFYKIYKLSVLPIPTNLEYLASKNDAHLTEVEKKDEQGYSYTFYARREDTSRTPVYWKRQDFPDQVYRSSEAKLRAITLELLRYHVIGRPQLVGTTSVEHSERLSDRLKAEPLTRLMQILLIRRAWMTKHNLDMIDRDYPEIKHINQPVVELEAGQLRPTARELGISLNPEDPTNLNILFGELNLGSADQNRLISALQGGIPHQVLNARKHDEESQIIARAGAFGAVTIATNMAGRGVDIKLGGELPDEVLQDVIRVLGRAGVANPFDMTNEERKTALSQLSPETYGVYEESVQGFLQYLTNMALVRQLGGLHVIGSERHEARRIDNQLRGRAARQGDPGSSRFYLALEDDLMRLFGGPQVEGMWKRLMADESLPLEVGLLGRLVEQSQERVEGRNFDIRKHLLEYDDVLNSQRKRIYAQRERVFTKDDLAEDVLDMLQSELQRRIPGALKDEEGPWKLLAYLEEIQPPFEFNGSYFPTFSLHLLVDEVRRIMPKSGEPLSGLREALLSLAGSVIQAEKEHTLNSVRAMLQKTAENLEIQVDERMETMNNYLDNQDQPDEDGGNPARRPQDMLVELSELVRLPLRLNNEQIRKLPDAGKDTRKVLREQIESMVLSSTYIRVIGAVERRLDESLDMKPAQLQSFNWEDFRNELTRSVELVFDQRMERLLGKQAQIAHDMDPFLDRLGEDALQEDRIVQLLGMMAQGSRMTFDRKTHRQGWKRVNRLNYVFLTARLLEDFPPQTVIEDVLGHLTRAQEALQISWGTAEMNRMSQANVNLMQFEEEFQQVVAGALGREDLGELASVPLGELDEKARQVLTGLIGKRSQNGIYRQVLLGVISEQWVDYLTKVEALRVSIGMEAYAQKDPLVQYKGQASEMFTLLLEEIRQGVVARMFMYHPQRSADSAPLERFRAEASPSAPIRGGGSDQDSEEPKKKRRRH